jgi:undecaprenyl diphosphate synthase
LNKPLDIIFPNPPSGLAPEALDAARIPEHIAVIMDGNGRWAKKRALNRLKGHKAGIEAVRETIRCASDLGVRYLTIYSFSTENWKRPQEEVVGLMDLFAKTMLAEVDGLHEEHVRVKTIGDLSLLPEETREAFEEVLAALRDRGVECVVKDTVCLATRERQESAADLAREVDAMIVIGGRNSSNTTRLAEICSSVCGNTHHIERASELDPVWFDRCTEVGITAGASTPEDQIAAVEARIASLG